MTHPVSFFIRPAPGLIIADPASGGYLPASGALMPRSAFWLRRLRDGDVLEASPPVKPVTPKPAKGAAKE